MVGDDLEGVLTAQVEGGEDGQETLRGEQDEYRQEEVRRSAVYLIMNGSIRIIQLLIVIDYPLIDNDNSQTSCSGLQTESTGVENQLVSA